MSTNNNDHDGQARSPAFYTAGETASMLRLDESTLYRHLRRGTFPGVKIGGRYVVPAAVIERLVADVLATGRCVDIVKWTQQEQSGHAVTVVLDDTSEVTEPLIVGGA